MTTTTAANDTYHSVKHRAAATAAGLPAGWALKTQLGRHIRVAASGRETRSNEWIVLDDNGCCIAVADRKAAAVSEAYEIMVIRAKTIS